MKLILLEKSYSIVKLGPSAPVPAWMNAASEFISVTRTSEELSIVCDEALVPINQQASGALENKRRALKVEGPLDFALTGILSQLLQPLAQAKISVFTISTFDTDYILIHESDISVAIELLRRSGHEIELANAKFDGGASSKIDVGQQMPAEKYPSWQPPLLETPRLLLRPLDEKDAADIFEYAKNPNVSKYTLWEPHASIAASLEYIREYVLPKYEQGLLEPYGIELKSNPGKIIGTVGCFWTSKLAKAMELAYAISEEHGEKGLSQKRRLS